MNIEQILNELYMADPELKKEEELIRKILIDMDAVRPGITADPNFIASLRKTVMEKAAQMSHQPASASLFTGLSFRFAMAGLAVALLVVVTGVSLFRGRTAISPVAGINELGENAFGPLAYQPSVGGRGGGGGGGGGGVAMTAPVPMAEDGKEMSTMIYPGPEFTQIDYVYKGDDFELASEGLVYKKRTGAVSGRFAANFLKDFPLSKLKNPNINEISFYEDREYGYMISVNLKDGVANFYQQWERWPQDIGCSTEECYRKDFLQPSQFPADAEIISMAENFLNEYGISRSGYGSPEMIRPWVINPLPAEVARYGYYPEVTVTYPLLVNDLKVYDEWGNLMGMNINVNLKMNRITNANNIALNGYDSSKYSLVADKEKVLDVAASGGAVGDMYIMGWEGRKLEPTLGTPEQAYMQFYMLNNGRSELMYVPALRFPILDIPAGASFYRQSVIVPLSEDVLNKLLERRFPMPVEPGGGSGSTNPGVPMPLTMPVPGENPVDETIVNPAE